MSWSPQAKAYVAAAWPQRIASSPSAGQAVAARLGLPDSSLAYLGLDALKLLSVTKTRGMPDLVHLNSPLLTQLKIPYPSAAGAARPEVRTWARCKDVWPYSCH